WALGPTDVIKAMANYQSQSVSCATSFVQKATVSAIRNVEQELKQSLVALKQRRDLACRLVSDLPGVGLIEPQGAFYIWPNVSAYFGKSFKGRVIENSKDFAELLLEDQKVAAVPGIEFGTEGFLRISYALSEDRMREAVQRLGKFLSTLT